jgi:hypothetical protein
MHSRNLLDQFASHTLLLHAALEHSADGTIKPLIRDADEVTVFVADPSDEKRVWLGGLLVGRRVADGTEVAAAQVSLGSLLLEELVDGVHLERCVSVEEHKWGQRVDLAIYLFFLVALLAQILTTASHLGASHRVLLGCEMLLDLDLCRELALSIK